MDSARLDFLLDRYLDEALTLDEKAELEGMLRALPHARLTFWQRTRFHALLRESGAEGWGRELARDHQRRWWDIIGEWAVYFRMRIGWVIGIAVIVALLGWGRMWRLIDQRAETGGGEVAVLTQAVDVKWGSAVEGHPVGEALAPGWLRLKAGLAQIEFSDGARLILEGPTELEIRSRSEAFCREGRLSAQVPPAAHGFKVASPRMTVIDLGTAFGFQAHAGAAQIHVFDGKVRLADALNAPKSELITGEGLAVDESGEWREIPAVASLFPDGEALKKKAASSWKRQDADWRRAADAWRADPTLILHYTFEGGSTFDRRLPNFANGEPRAEDGAIVGCRWAEGRWPGKGALEFKGTGDRVRIEIAGVFDAMTLAGWVRVDNLEHGLNALLMADGFDRGAIHWQITNRGVVRLGIAGAPDFDTPVIFTDERLGQWVHLAVVMDRTGHREVHYVDGKEVSARALKIDLPLGFGRAEVGNWNPTKNQLAGRGFHGCIDEMMVFRRSLSAAEVRDLARAGEVSK